MSHLHCGMIAMSTNLKLNYYAGKRLQRLDAIDKWAFLNHCNYVQALKMP